ncbi:zinc finger protein 808-like [Cylas formicarius]|uniref:zinc finger protein 808-like n=1 Tax=Cylas formicarius TaxID=197179 RepID=UPI00295880BC|nr:zinc finger protein 808-like [Cylas formicarius]
MCVPRKRYVCNVCGKKYNHQPNLSRHKNLECQKPKSRLCPFCPYACYHKFQLKGHCSKSYRRWDSLRRHIRVECCKKGQFECHKPFQCNGCDRFYKYKRNILEHIKHECGKSRRFSCPYCPHKSHRKFNLNLHIRTVHKVCPSCFKIYKTRNSLNVHKSRDCANSKRFRCNTCAKVLKRKEAMKYHISGSPGCQTAASHVVGEFSCNDCGKRYKHRASLYNHSRFECGQAKNVACPVETCSYKTKRKGSESIHCNLCGAVFRHLASLKYHVTNNVCTKPKKDEAAKILKCNACGKVFKGWTAMDYHVRRRVCEQPKIQTGPPYICMWCKHAFNIKQTWYVHLKRQACRRFPQKYGLKSAQNFGMCVPLEYQPIVELKQESDPLSIQPSDAETHEQMHQ